MIITPILAFGGYFATDYIVSERPHSAVPGSSYPLAAKSNCRYQSGRCTLKNGDIEIELTSELGNNENINFQIHSDLPLHGAKIALTSTGSEQLPQQMQAIDTDQTQWQTTLKNRDIDNAKLLVVISVDDVLYYGETETTFTTYKTSFSQANMQ